MAHTMIFIVILGLIHARETSSILQADMIDQKERDWIDDVPINAQGESLNTVRFDEGQQLARNTVEYLYFLTGVGTGYLISTVSLFFGSLQNKPEFILVWLILHSITGVIFAIGVFFGEYCTNDVIPEFFGGSGKYCKYENHAFKLLYILFITLIICSVTILFICRHELYNLVCHSCLLLNIATHE